MLKKNLSANNDIKIEEHPVEFENGQYQHLNISNNLNGPSRKLLHCKYCGKSFKRNDYLVIHQRIHTPSVYPYNCIHCGRTFKRRSDLAHKSTHTKHKRTHYVDTFSSA